MMMLFGFLPIVLILFGTDLVYSARRVFTEKKLSPNGIRKGMPEQKQLDGAIFRLAKEHNGKITISDVVIETGLDIKGAEKYMNSITDSAHVAMEVDQDGKLIYVFPELREDPRRDKQT